jgi:peroxiredoxin
LASVGQYLVQGRKGKKMPLQSKLDAFKTGWVHRVGADIAQMVADDNANLQPLAAKVLKSGDQFPRSSLQISLGGPLVVTFYRGGWCPYCNLELRAYQEVLPKINKLGAQLVAISPETPDNTLSTAEKNDLSFTGLSDAKGKLADALGIHFELSPALRAYFMRAGHDLPARNGDDRWSLPMPATYVVEQGGRIAFAHVDPDYRSGSIPQRPYKLCGRSKIDERLRGHTLEGTPRDKAILLANTQRPQDHHLPRGSGPSLSNHACRH